MNTVLGTITAGSLGEGFTLRLNTAARAAAQTGNFVCIADGSYRHLCLITDLALQCTNAEILESLPTIQNTVVQRMVRERFLAVTAHLKPLLTLTEQGSFFPTKTVPLHGAEASIAPAETITTIFGSDTYDAFFAIGTPLSSATPVCIDLGLLAERSSGIFGKTGTGKTFITRLLLAGMITRQKAVSIIFDMHNEYGFQARAESSGKKSMVKGLKTLFPSSVVIFSLDAQSTRRRGGSPDVTITLSYESIRVEDVLSLQEELNLHPTACEAAYLLAARYHKQWLTTLFASQNKLAELAVETGAHPESLAALYRKLKILQRLPFFTPEPEQYTVIDQMLSYIDRGISIVIEFGSFTSTICYLLIANIITRRLHKAYLAKVEAFLGDPTHTTEPRQLLIVIEEAHKFLNPVTARQTIFGLIAREMRKYYVSLLIVDQRPSSIDTEIMSQIGTKFIAQLSDEKDIAAALVGTAHAQDLKNILTTLGSKGQTLVIGHAIPMPVVINTRPYDEKFYREVAQPADQVKKMAELLY